MNLTPDERPAPRFFLQPRPAMGLAVGHVVALPDKLAHHVRVLRLAAGDRIVLFDGSGGEYVATLEGVGKHTVLARLDAFSPREAEPGYRIVLAQGIAGGDKMDWLIEKSVELGVHAIQPLQTQRAVVRLAGERAVRRVEHWQALVQAACEQCGRNRVPTVLPIATIDGWLGATPAQTGLLLSPRATGGLADAAASPALAAARRQGEPIVVLAGPEGGLTLEEEAAAAARGLVPARMGERILRCETAGTAALAALAALWGEF